MLTAAPLGAYRKDISMLGTPEVEGLAVAKARANLVMAKVREEQSFHERSACCSVDELMFPWSVHSGGFSQGEVPILVMAMSLQL